MNDHYRRIFREEASELLIELETALLDLEQSPSDIDLIGRVFRALHTLKGSSAMFGYEEAAAFTHEIETVFELFREGGGAVGKELIGLTLQARDLIMAMLTASGESTGDLADRARQMVASFQMQVPVAATAMSSTPTASHPLPAAVPAAFHIRYQPGEETFRSGVNPVTLFNELHLLGECRVTVITDAVPPLEELDPSRCHLAWEIHLVTDAGIDAIRDVFIFAGDDELEITPVEATGEAAKENGNRLSGNSQEAAADSVVAEPAGMEPGREAISSIRIPAEKLDTLVNLVGELVTVQARLSQTAAGRDDAELVALAEEVERLTGELRDSALGIRMLPIGSTFNRFRRLVHDLATELGKEVDITCHGDETELDKTVIELLTDPLIHLIRNCIDHGIESPEVRVAAGKPRQGTVHLSAVHSGESVIITIADDGAGIDRQAVHERGLQKGLIPHGVELPDRELLNLIFSPGFSTSQEITSISGRGVGMDVVKRGVDALRGNISVASEQGKGTAVTIRMPLTLAIIESLLVQIGTDCYMLPLSLVEECLELTGNDAARANGRHLINVRGQIIPYIRLRDRFGVCGAPPAIEQVVVTELDGKRVGFAVDHVIGGHQTVIKSLGKVFRNVIGVSGATILGDGTVALILDIAELVQAEEQAEWAA
ncbi:MAG: chemotaxis protein CheA [Geobacter sp.]|nr:MAG: chemotaxis protein CheA [Geobacter sp.]